MKVILLQNIEKLGKKFETKEVAAGFARNYLLPKGLAVIYNLTIAKIYEEKREEEKNLNLKANKLEKINKIDQLILNFKERATATGKLYAQINKNKLLKKLDEEYQLKLKPPDLIIQQPLKEIGTYLVGIKPNYYDKIKVIIEKDEKS